jgi:hypothetical protein
VAVGFTATAAQGGGTISPLRMGCGEGEASKENRSKQALTLNGFATKTP